MKGKELDNIKKLYETYGFEVLESNERFSVFLHASGYFYNAEIINYSAEEEEIKRSRNYYEGIGYSVTEKKYSNYQKIHDELFRGFFLIHNMKKKHIREYEVYCEKQKQKLNCKNYEYLDCTYIYDNNVFSDGLIELVYDTLSAEGAQLMILEAAAGYGKTCTSYEILNRYAKSEVQKVPLIAELSRNRRASIFRYVLLSEIDRCFTTLSAKVVEDEIKNGNVPLIIDGFDELLSKSVDFDNTTENSFEEAQSMLDTVSEFLKGDSKAKILITARKSSIFTGQQFEDWIENRDLNCNITRIELQSPQVKDWIGERKTEILLGKKIDLDYIANPILLSLLRECDEKYVEEHTVNDIIERYFEMLLEREKERQSLPLLKEEQLMIMEKVAGYFADLNTSAESPDMVQLIISEIIENDVAEYLSRYDGFVFSETGTKPNEEEFVMKLTHHALLDRVIPGKNLIGFINEFIFGVLIGKALVNGYIKQQTSIEYKYIDLVATAFSIKDIEGREEVQKVIYERIERYTKSQQLEIFNKLFHENLCAYKNETFSDLTFNKGFRFNEGFIIENCAFVNCVFDKCIIDKSAFFQCQFYNCSFYQIEVWGENEKNNDLIFLGCTGHEDLLKELTYPETEIHDVEIDYEKIVLEQFWKVGSNLEPRRAFRTIYKGIENNKLPAVDKALKRLIHRKVLLKKTFCYEVNFEMLDEIAKILGR